MDSQRHLGLLLSTVVKSLFENVSVQPQMLKEEIYAEVDVTPEAAYGLFETCRDLIEQAAAEDMEPSQFETLVQAQQSLSATQQDLLVKFWRSQKQEIHSSVYRKMTWNNTLQKFAWRIDLKSKTKSGGEHDLNEPTAIVELTIGKSKQAGQEAKMVRFEMDRERLATILLEINNIQQQIDSRTAIQ